MNKLYDFLVSKQIYLESVKNYSNASFRKELPKLVKELRQLLIENEIDSLSKRKLESLVKSLRKATHKFFDVWANQLLKMLDELARADFDVVKTSISEYGIIENESRPFPFSWIEKEENDKIFALILASVVPAVGMTLSEYINSIPTIAADRVEQIVKAGIADNLSESEIANNIIGTKANNFKDGVLLKSLNNAESASDTSFQHSDVIVTAGLLATIANKYRWISIIDYRTSDICRYRNRRIYVTGKGPLPPAHNRCRSTTVPVILGQTTPDESFAQWLRRQPEDIQKHVLGKKYNLWASGKLDESAFPKFKEVNSLSIEQFKSKLSR